MSGEIMNTKEVANYLRIHEKQVYALIKSKKIPSTRITGKWIFPKNLIDEWIELNARKNLERVKQKNRSEGGFLLASGSNDPILDILQTHMKQMYPEFSIFCANTGSTEGLKALNLGYTDIAWAHLFDPASHRYNIPFLSTYLPDVNPVVLNLFYRDLGFITAPKNPYDIQNFADLPRQDIKFINRQKGSGTRVLLDHYLNQLQISPSTIKGYEKEVYTHFEVGLAILSKEADVGIATSAVSKLLELTFIPIIKERFDMILDQSNFFEKVLQALIETLNSEVFRKRIAKLGNYDLRDSGKILYSNQLQDYPRDNPGQFFG